MSGTTATTGFINCPVRRLVLASRSPRRRALLAGAGIDVECDPSGVEELTRHEESPRGLALANAHSKAQAVAMRRAGDVVLGADTIVVFENAVFGKPRDLKHAGEMLGRLSGHTHEVLTAVSILHWASRRNAQFCEVTRVRFRDLSEGQIRDYLAEIEPLDKAGAYAAQEDRGRIIAEVEGSFTNVVGLPMERTLAVLRGEFGFSKRGVIRLPAAEW